MLETSRPVASWCLPDGRPRNVLAVIVTVLTACLPGVTGAAVTLVREGRPAAHVLTPDQADAATSRATDDLLDHIEKMTGARLPVFTHGQDGEATGLPIRIGAACGDAFIAELREQAGDPASIRVRVTPSGVDLAGLSLEAHHWAVVELLEQAGVRWFFPGELGTVIPDRPTLTVAEQDLIDEPSFAGRRLVDLGRAEIANPWAARMRHGGIDGGRHGFPGGFNRQTEPELYARTADGLLTSMLEMSHPEVFRRVLEACREQLERQPDLKYLSMGPGDGVTFGQSPWDADDFDPFHASHSTTDRYVRFFNQLLEALEPDYPDVGIAFYAYSTHMRPPVREKPNPRILPVFAPIDVDRWKSLHNPLSWERQYLKQVIEGWQSLGVDMLYRGYFFNLADQGMPFSMLRQIGDEIPYFHQSGLIGCRVECKAAYGYHAPSLYLASRLMWNAQADPDAIIQDYFDKLYGPASAPMLAHFMKLEDVFEHADYYTGNIYDFPHVLTPEVMAELEETLSQAEAIAAADETLAARIAMVRLQFDFGRDTLAMIDAFHGFDLEKAGRIADHLLDEVVPKALAHRPMILNFRYAGGFTERFWAGSIRSAVERTTGDNELLVSFPDAWRFFLDPGNAGEELGLWKHTLGVQSWGTLKTFSQSWSNQGLRYYKGGVWYRTTVTVPGSAGGRKVHLWLGGVDDTAQAWINGVKLELTLRGAAPSGRPWEFDATPAIRPGEEHVVVINVTNFVVDELGTGGLTGPVMLWAGAQASGEDFVAPEIPR